MQVSDPEQAENQPRHLTQTDIENIGLTLRTLGLPTSRTQDLVEIAAYTKMQGCFVDEYLTIHYDTDENGVEDVSLTFLFGIDPSELRQSRANIIAMALDALEAYIVLVEAGIIDAPTLISADTNGVMARFASRAGFRVQPATDCTEECPVRVVATYDDIKASVLAVCEQRKERLRLRALAYPFKNNDAAEGVEAD